MNIPLLRLEYTEEDIQFINEEIVKVLKSGYLTMGEKVREFEEMFAKFIGTKYAIGVNSGTSALEIILRAIGVEGSTVIVPSNTFMATAIAVIHAGGRVIFAESMIENLCISPDDLVKKIQRDTKCVILVHIGGIITPYFNDIKRICEEYELFLIEDAAHAHGSRLNGVNAGNLGIAGAFSFYPTKVLTTAEGGMVTTNNEKIYEKALILREHGKTDHSINIHSEFGYNWRFSELHAVLGLQQMRRAEQIISERKRLAKIYDAGLKDLKGIRLIDIPANIQSSYYKYIVYLEERFNRNETKSRLKKEFNISLTGEVYSDPCHSQPVFKKYPNTVANKTTDKFPLTEYISDNHICLPLYSGLRDEELNYVICSLKKVLI